MLVAFWKELLNWGLQLVRRLPVRAPGCVNDCAAALSEGPRPKVRHLEAVWRLFVALSWANEGSPEIYVSKVVFLFTQRPAGPCVSTAPVHPLDCFMKDSNSLINHCAGHCGYSSAQISHKMTETCCDFWSLHKNNCWMVPTCFQTVVHLQAASSLCSHWSSLFYSLPSFHKAPSSIPVPCISPPPPWSLRSLPTSRNASQGHRAAQRMKIRDCHRAI